MITLSVDINIDKEKVFEELKDSDIIDEVIARKITASEIGFDISDITSTELKRLLCDYLGVSYHTSNEELLKGISEKI